LLVEVRRRQPRETFDEALSKPHPLVDVSGALLDPHSTTVELAFDDTALVVRFVCAGTPPFRADVLESNGPVFDDECVEVFLCEAGSAARYQEIVVNPRGVVYGARVDNPDDSRVTWKLSPGALPPGLQAHARIGESSWTCRLVVPWLGALGPPPVAGEVRRGNLYRIARGPVSRFEALSATGRASPPDFHVPTRFASLRFE
jgi:hypothetical protein